MVRSEKEETSSRSPDVADKGTGGTLAPVKCEQAPSSWGMGRFRGKVVSVLGQRAMSLMSACVLLTSHNCRSFCRALV